VCCRLLSSSSRVFVRNWLLLADSCFQWQVLPLLSETKTWAELAWTWFGTWNWVCTTSVLFLVTTPCIPLRTKAICKVNAAWQPVITECSMRY
jgi:hypothetical protein